LKFASPEYVAVSVQVPRSDSVREQEPLPAESVATQLRPEPSLTVTVTEPVRLPVAGTAALTATETVKAWPEAEGSGKSDEMTVTVFPRTLQAVELLLARCAPLPP
jgi:hypothetical protein